MPIIFITGHGDVPMSVQAMKAAAVEFLTSRSRTTCCWNAIVFPSSGVAPPFDATRRCEP